MALAGDIKFQLLHAPELLSPVNHDLLANINNIINAAYSIHSNHPAQLHSEFQDPRLTSHDQIIHELGKTGRIVVATQGSRDNVVACASVKRWKGFSVATYLAHLATSENGRVSDAKARIDSSEDEWEIATCATNQNVEFKGKGLITRAVEMLTTELQRVQGAGKTLTLYVTALEGSGNTEYWQRRGYDKVLVEDAPAGMWSSLKPFKIATLKKVVP